MNKYIYITTLFSYIHHRLVYPYQIPPAALQSLRGRATFGWVRMFRLDHLTLLNAMLLGETGETWWSTAISKWLINGDLEKWMVIQKFLMVISRD